MRKTNWSLLCRALESPKVRTIYMDGPPGIGKTYAAYNTGRTQNGVCAITMTEDTPAAELRGHYLPKENGEFVWQDGPLLKAMRAGARLVINEITHGSPEALSMLHPILEGEATAMLTLPTNETVRPARTFHIVATDNFPPEDLPDALQDRFECSFFVGEPHPDAIAGLSSPFREAAARTPYDDPERSVSLRGWYALDKLSRAGWTIPDACEAVLGQARGEIMVDQLKMLSVKTGIETLPSATKDFGLK